MVVGLCVGLLCVAVFIILTDGTGHFVNVALHKSCNISSKWDADRSVNDAVNGDTGGSYKIGNNCIHTGRNDFSPWWEVNLGRPYPVYNITVWARDEPDETLRYRMQDCEILVDGAECYSFDTVPATREIPITCSSGVLNGTVVRVSRSGPRNDHTINICEFQVFSCSEDYWGSGCDRRCGQCSEGEVCDKVTGHCSSCSPGWRMPLCDQVCINGTYGNGCNQTCSPGCDDVCAKVTGNCTCTSGWQGSTCDMECAPGQYGSYCTETCSAHCDDTCDTGTGVCNCTVGYLPPTCTEAAPETADQTSLDGAVIGGAAGGAVVVLVVVVVVILVVVIVRRRRSQTKGSTKEGKTYVSHEVSPGHSDDNVYHNISSVSAPSEATARAPQAKTPKKKMANKNPSPVTTNGKSRINETFLNPDTAVYHNLDPSCADRAKTTKVKIIEEPDVEEVGDEEVEPEEEWRDDAELLQRGVYYNDDVYMTSEATDVKLDATQQHLLDKLRGSDLDKEFKKLPEGLTKAHDTGADRENYYRNRFRSILPYEESRVVLRGAPDPGSNDYINASYIPGPLSPKQYMAAQGPKPNTVGDFWKMVWQDKVTTIVMLTNLKEGKKPKCALYWPNAGTASTYGSVDVIGREVCQTANYVKRTFDIKVGKGASRHVTQYHYTTWPDHGVPTTTALVDLWRTVRHGHSDQQHPSPCWSIAGTYIALDTVMDRLQHQTQPSADLGVCQEVKELRRHRCHMVQAKSQYVVLHEALLEAYSSQGCRLSLLTFDSYFRHPVDPQHSNTRIDTQFLKLKQMKVLLHKPRHTEAEREDNINKNRNLDVLPDDSHLVHTLIPVDGRNDYINAVRVQTLGGPRGYLLTQLPLADTMVDLWRLVIGSDVSLIVSVGSDADESERKYCYWPRKQNQRLTFGPITVRLTSQSTQGKHLARYSLSVAIKGVSGPRQVTLLHYGDWGGELPGSLQDFLHLLDCVRSTEPPPGSANSPVLLQCKNGASKSGLFVVINDVINQLTTDRVVDVYMAVRNLHMVRPECMTSKVQYRYVFTTVQEYRSRNDIYNNA